MSGKQIQQTCVAEYRPDRNVRASLRVFVVGSVGFGPRVSGTYADPGYLKALGTSRAWSIGPFVRLCRGRGARRERGGAMEGPCRQGARPAPRAASMRRTASSTCLLSDGRGTPGLTEWITILWYPNARRASVLRPCSHVRTCCSRRSQPKCKSQVRGRSSATRLSRWAFSSRSKA